MMLRVVIGESALAELEQRMWQLRQVQLGFFQDELSRIKNAQLMHRNETKQLGESLEKARRERKELMDEILNERRARDKVEQITHDRFEAVAADVRQEGRAREAMEATLRKEIENARQGFVKYAAASERHMVELKSAVAEESGARGKSIEALLAEWAGDAAETRAALDALRSDVENQTKDAEQHTKGLLREGSAREAFEQFFGEKIKSVELMMGKIEERSGDIDGRIDGLRQMICDVSGEMRTLHTNLAQSPGAGEEGRPRCP